MGCTFLYYNAPLVKSLKISPMTLIASLALENFINLLSSSLIVFTILSFFFPLGISAFLSYLACCLWLLAVVTLITFISSLLNILFKDTKYILHFLFTLLYFSTPTFYHLEKLPELFQKIISLNPLYWLISLFRLNSSGESVSFILIINSAMLGVLIFLSFYVWKKLKVKIYLKL